MLLPVVLAAAGCDGKGGSQKPGNVGGTDTKPGVLEGAPAPPPPPPKVKKD